MIFILTIVKIITSSTAVLLGAHTRTLIFFTIRIKMKKGKEIKKFQQIKQKTKMEIK